MSVSDVKKIECAKVSIVFYPISKFEKTPFDFAIYNDIFLNCEMHDWHIILMNGGFQFLPMSISHRHVDCSFRYDSLLDLILYFT